MDKKENFGSRSQNVSAEQKCLLYKLVDEDQELKSTKFISRWKFIAEQLNTLKGSKKTAKEWWLRYQLENKCRTAGQASGVSEKRNIQPTVQLNPSISSTEPVTCAPGQTDATLNTLAAALNDLNTNDISKLKSSTMHKLKFLLCADDHNDWLDPSYRMSITDWLLFDTVLVHENFDVIQVHRENGTGHKALLALFHLVEKYNIESFEGDSLAEAWAALTIEYNAAGRQCTPMLLQRRWYQLKLAARESIYKFRLMYLATPNDMKRVLKFKPTSLQLAVLVRYSQKVVLEPFMSWEDQIKNGLVILREQFVSIAMKSKIGQTPSTHTETLATIDLTSTEDEINIIKNKEFGDVTLQQVTPIEYNDENMSSEAQEHETSQIIEKGEECLIRNDPEVSIETTPNEKNNSDASMDKMTLDTMTEPDKLEDNEMDTENYPSNDIPISDKPTVVVPDPFREIIGFDKQKPVLPQITNVFGNVQVPIEALSKISVLATKIAKNNIENKRHINASHSEQNNQINEGLEIDCEIDKAEAIDDGKPLGTMVDEQKKEVPTKDKKLFMIPVVNTVKLEDMGVLPTRLWHRVKNKEIIDVVNTKSKVTDDKAPKLKNNKKFSLNKVQLCSSRVNKSRQRSYSYSELSKNPDFNIPLKKLNRQFFRSDRNRMLLRACKPLCVVVDKSFESKLVNGRMYLKPTAFCQNNESFDQMKPNDSHPNVFLESSDAKKNIRNTNTEQAFIPIASQPFKDNISLLPLVPDALPSNSPHDLIPMASNPDKFNIALPLITSAIPSNSPLALEFDTLPSSSSFETNRYQNTNSPSKKIITIVPSKNTEPTDTEPLLVNNSYNASERLLDLYTLNKLLCMLVNVEMNKTEHNDIKATAKQNKVVDKGSNNLKDTSEPTVNNSGTDTVNADKTEGKKTKYYSKHIKPCCWAQAKLRSMDTIGKRVLLPHNCVFPSCECCCKKILAMYYINNKIPKNNNSKPPKQKNKSKNKLIELNDFLADVVTTFSDQSLDKFLSLGNNKILLTTTKFPKNFNLFTGFQRYLENNLLPKAIRLVLKPNGRVFLKRDIRAPVDPKILKEIIDLVDEFNQLSRVPTAQHNNNNKKNNKTFPDKTPNTTLNKESSCIEDTKEIDISIPEHIKETPKSVISEQLKLTLNPIFCNTTTTILSAQFKQEPQPTKENATVMDKIKSCLGMVFYKTLTPIKLVSELKYAYSQNGLFFKLDLDTGSLVPINVCIKMHRIPILDFDPGSNNSLSVPRKHKTLFPINSQSPSLLTYDLESVSSQSPISILSTSPGPISSSLPGEISCKPIESTVSEFSIPDNNGLCNVSNISYASDIPFIRKPLVSLKVEDEYIISDDDDDNAESWNIFDKFLNIDDGPEEYIEQQKESSNAPIGFEDQIVKILKVEQV
ncbi:unnamed protein product [Arctia plantaginis]|uniref:Uncharacterized protein n=1 Tax=Arctia plantaginis TaxID=874455 RepID=A0A8S0ZAT7_ARCPL|nr:unnamed protein product [Arctia plantaginis]